MTAAALWTEVKANYATQDLLNLTNIHDTGSVAIDDTVGQAASQSVIDLWPAYAQVAYDSTDALHVEVGSMAVIAKLFERGGTASGIAKQKWDDIFTDGVIAQLKNTGPRGHGGPSSNNTHTQQPSEALAGGESRRPWSSESSLPSGIIPGAKGVQSD